MSRSLCALIVSALALLNARCAEEARIIMDDPALGSTDYGTASLQLQLDAALAFETVTLTLKYPSGTTQTQTIDVAAEDATISAFLGELPVDNGYEVSLSTTASNGSVCSGTSFFNVRPDEAVTVMVRMQCGGGEANPNVGAARVRAEIIPAQGECPSVIDRVTVAPARAGIGVPIAVTVVPTAGPAPVVSYAADDGVITGMGLRATFRCTSAGEVHIDVDATRAGCLHHAQAWAKCFDDGTPYVPPANGGAGGGGNPGGGNPGGGNPGGGNPGGGNLGGGGAGGAAGGGGNACQTCTANNCAAQLTSCQSEPTSSACLENRTCSNVGAANGCAAASSVACYCGTRPAATCLVSGGNGACADVITRTSGCDDGRPAADIPTCVTERFLDIQYGLGDAYQLVACQRRNCPTQCALTR